MTHVCKIETSPKRPSATGDGPVCSLTGESLNHELEMKELNENSTVGKTDDEKSLDQLEILRRCRSVKQGLEALR